MTRSRTALACFFALALLLAACEPGAESEGYEPSADELAGWDEAAAERAEGKADNASCSGSVLPDQRGFAKRIALTFDDGPHLTNTPKVLEILAAHDIKATFFVNGNKITSDAHRALLQEMAAAGHLIGNHSQNHKNLKTVGTTTLRAEVTATGDTLTALGLAPRYFRFPFGSAGCTAAGIVREYGYRVTGWHIDSADWCYASATGGVGYCDARTFRWVPDRYRSDIVAYVASQAKATGGGVLLFHDVHGYTTTVLDAVLSRLEADGFTFVRLDDAATFPNLNEVPPAPPAWVGTTCQDDAPCAFTANDAAGTCFAFSRADDATLYGFCTLACEGFCPDLAGAGRTFCTSLDGATGQCVLRAGPENEECARLPGTAPRDVDRFIGASSASAKTVSACVPE